MSQIPGRTKQQYKLVGGWDEDGKHGYEWRWLVPETLSGRVSYYEVAVITADAFWAGRNSFGYYMDSV